MKLCDTSVLVDIDRGGIDEKVHRLDEQGRHAISLVTVTELRLGVHLRYDQGTDQFRSAMDGLDRLLARFEIVPLAPPIANAAADVMGALRAEGQPIDDLHDIYIAATAMVRQLPLLTANVADFERVADIEVIDWTSF